MSEYIPIEKLIQKMKKIVSKKPLEVNETHLEINRVIQIFKNINRILLAMKEEETINSKINVDKLKIGLDENYFMIEAFIEEVNQLKSREGEIQEEQQLRTKEEVKSSEKLEKFEEENDKIKEYISKKSLEKMKSIEEFINNIQKTINEGKNANFGIGECKVKAIKFEEEIKNRTITFLCYAKNNEKNFVVAKNIYRIVEFVNNKEVSSYNIGDSKLFYSLKKIDWYGDITFFKARYFIYVANHGVFSKSVGKEHQWKLFYKEDESCSYGRCLKDFGNFLIIGNWKRLTIVEVDGDEYSKKGTIEGRKVSNSNIRDFLVCDKRVIVLTEDNHVGVFDKKGKILQKKYLASEREGDSLAICDQNKYLFSSELGNDYNSSVIRVSKITKGRITELTMLVREGMEFTQLNSFSFFGYFRNSLIFSAISFRSDSELLTFKYNIEKNKLVELTELRKYLDIGYVQKLSRKNNGDIFGAGWDNKILEINYKAYN